MDVSPYEIGSEDLSERHPLLMERTVGSSDHEHVINVMQGTATPSSSHDDLNSLDSSHEDRSPTDSTQVQHPPSSSTLSSSRNSSFMRRGDNYGRRHRSPLNSGLWISVELVIAVSQIIASVIVLSLSRHEKPKAPLFVWVVGYASGCLATLPLLYWRYITRNRFAEQDSAQMHVDSNRDNPSLESASYAVMSTPQAPEAEVHHRTTSNSWIDQHANPRSTRIGVLVDHFKMALDCFFAVWFVVGNVWIFGGHSSSSEAPNLYRLCIVFLTFSCIGYAMPFILCATICCCLPCIISILGFREDQSYNRGATEEAINGLPSYKFKAKGGQQRTDDENEIDSDGLGDGGTIAVGTERERLVSAEDAVCCICLAKYVNNDELRELPCAHFFHVECVDKWLKINALCPLCKHEVGISSSSTDDLNLEANHGEQRVGTVITGAYAMV
ncbi:E3 ubiquitin-protein ligase [Nymphaea thermarum]|nr:E3 ubiquitin-protein ligase [Nymphaea thermarum]